MRSATPTLEELRRAQLREAVRSQRDLRYRSNAAFVLRWTTASAMATTVLALPDSGARSVALKLAKAVASLLGVA